MSRQAAQFARVAVLNCKLKVVAWISLVGAGELQAEMLPDFRQLLLRVGSAEAEIVDPKDALLFLGKRRRRILRGGGKMVPQKGRSGQDFERFAARQRRDAEFRELVFDCGCGAAVFLEEWAPGSPLRSGFFKDALCVLAAVARRLAFETIAHLTHETLAVCQCLRQRPIKTEALADEKLEVCAANAVALCVSRALARDAVA